MRLCEAVVRLNKHHRTNFLGQVLELRPGVGHVGLYGVQLSLFVLRVSIVALHPVLQIFLQTLGVEAGQGVNTEYAVTRSLAIRFEGSESHKSIGLTHN